MTLPRKTWLIQTAGALVFLISAPAHLPAAPAPAPTGVKSPALSAAERKAVAWLPAPAKAQQEVFDALQAKVGHRMYRPELPAGEHFTGQWFFTRQPSSHDPAAVYPVIYENLLVAKKLLNGSNLEDRRLGLVIARYSNLWLRQSLNDTTLSPRLLEGFLLPYLDIAYPENWRSVSRRQILEDADDAYRAAGETEHRKAVLRHLIRFGPDLNTTDWARMELGQALAAQGRYDEAADAVEAITAPGMAGGKALAVGWRKEADAQAKARAAQPVHDDPEARNIPTRSKKRSTP